MKGYASLRRVLSITGAVLGKLENLAGGTLAEVPHELGVVGNLAPACELDQETRRKSPVGT